MFADCSPDFPWDRAEAEKWSVTEMVIDETSNILNDTHLLWTKDGRRGAGGKSIRLGDLREDFSSIGTKWREKIFKLAASYLAEPLPVTFHIFVVGDTVYDGCHRVAAAYVSGGKYRIHVVGIVPKGGALWKTSDLKGFSS